MTKTSLCAKNAKNDIEISVFAKVLRYIGIVASRQLPGWCDVKSDKFKSVFLLYHLFF